MKINRFMYICLVISLSLALFVGASPFSGIAAENTPASPDEREAAESLTAMSATTTSATAGTEPAGTAPAGPPSNRFETCAAETADSSENGLPPRTVEAAGSISGHVFHADGTTPLAGVLVMAENLDESISNCAESTADGSYTLSGLPSGLYRIWASSSGCPIKYYVNVYDYSSATAVAVNAPEDTAGIDFCLEPGGSISGFVFQLDGFTPLAGAWLILSGDNISQRTMSASDGSYTISNLPSGSYRVMASASGYITEYYDNQVNSHLYAAVPVNAPADTPEINFCLEPGGSISGYIFQEDGFTPLADAEILAQLSGAGYAYTGYGYSNGDGAYSVTGLVSGSYEVLVSASGYIPEYYDNQTQPFSSSMVEVTAPADSPGIDFSLEPGGTITGHVYGEDGSTPLSYAYISVWLMESQYALTETTYTGSDGSYIISGLPSGDYRVRVKAAGYLSRYYDNASASELATPVSINAPYTTPDIDFILERGGSLCGRVFQADGITPLVGVQVRADLLQTGVGFTASARTATDGSYTLSGLPSGNYRVRAYADDYLTQYFNNVYYSAAATPVAVSAPGITSGIDFVMTTGGVLYGHIYQADGYTPLEGGTIHAEPFDNRGFFYATSSAADGSYNLPGLPAGSYLVKATAAGYQETFYDNVREAAAATPVDIFSDTVTAGIDFRMDAGGPITGHIYQSDTVTPLAGAKISVYDGSHTASAVSAADGSYATPGLTSGNYLVRVSCAGYISEYYDNVYHAGSAARVPVNAPAETPGIDFCLDTGGSISGHIFQADGSTPLAAAEIAAELTSAGENFYGYTVSDSDGSYTLPCLISGTYRVIATAAGYMQEYYDDQLDPQKAAAVIVESPADTPNIDFSLDTGGSISGYVYQEDGFTPLAGATLYAQLTGAGFSRTSSALSASDGSYTISNLPSGSYFIEASAPNFITEYYDNHIESKNLDLVEVNSPADTPAINFSLEPGGSISGLVYLTDRVAGAVEVTAELVGAGYSYSRNTFSLSDGRYSLTGLPSGEYRVQVIFPGYIREYYDNVTNPDYAAMVPVSAPDVTDSINFRLESGGSISGRVYQAGNGAPLADALVRVNLYNAGYNYSMDTFSLPDGSYAVKGLPSGDYLVQAGFHGYLTEYYDHAFDSASALPVTVSDPADTPGIDFSLEVGGAIAGSVHGAGGSTPPVETRITVSRRVDNFTIGQVFPPEPDGSYYLGGLPPGEYLVRAEAPGYITEYYDNVTRLEAATPITVDLDTITPGIDFTLDEGGTISGRVFQADGCTPLAGVDIRAFPDNHTAKACGYAVSSSDGGYCLSGLPSGRYLVLAETAGYYSMYYQAAFEADNATPVEVVQPSATTDIDFTLKPVCVPPPPGGLGALIHSAVQVELYWTYDSNLEDGFRLERSLSRDFDNLTQLAVACNLNTCLDNTTAAGTTYYYRLLAFNTVGDSEISENITVEIPALPGCPSDLKAAAVSRSRIDLTWTDNATCEEGFQIERKTGSEGTFAVIASPGPDNETFSDTGLSAATTYYYRVRAVNIAGVSDYTSEVAARTWSSSGGGSVSGSGTSGGSSTTAAVYLSGFQSASSLKLDSAGTLTSAVQLPSADGGLVMAVSPGTRLLTASGGVLSGLTVTPLESPTGVPETTAIVRAYSLGPQGARFEPALTLTFNYDPALLPSGVAAESLYVAVYDGAQWQQLVSSVDTLNRTVSAVVTHFSDYALLGELPQPAALPAPDETPLPTPTPSLAPETGLPSPSVTSPVAASPDPGSASSPPAAEISAAALPAVAGNEAEPAGIRWGLIAGLAAGLVVLILLVTLLVRRTHRV